MSSPSIKSTFSQAQSVGAFASPTGVKVPRPYARKEVLVEKTGIAPADPSPIGEKTGKSKIFTRSEQDASLYPAGHWVANHTRKIFNKPVRESKQEREAMRANAFANQQIEQYQERAREAIARAEARGVAQGLAQAQAQAQAQPMGQGPDIVQLLPLDPANLNQAPVHLPPVLANIPMHAQPAVVGEPLLQGERVAPVQTAASGWSWSNALLYLAPG